MDALNFDTTGMEKILESQFVRFIDTTPNALSPTWKLIGPVETDNGHVEYNPEMERTKWIVDKSARTNHKSNDKQMSVPLQCYKGDPVHTFVNAGRDKLNYITHVLEVDLWDKTGNNYSAKMSDATVGITSYNGNMIEFNLYFDGDPQEGSITLAGQEPTFVPTTSL